jgi:hypothetical protein
MRRRQLETCVQRARRCSLRASEQVVGRNLWASSMFRFLALLDFFPSAGSLAKSKII